MFLEGGEKVGDADGAGADPGLVVAEHRRHHICARLAAHSPPQNPPAVTFRHSHLKLNTAPRRTISIFARLSNLVFTMNLPSMFKLD